MKASFIRGHVKKKLTRKVIFMKQCLACWEDIEEQDKICLHCGSNQDEIKDYLALVLLKQRKKKITIPEQTSALDYVIDVDPKTAEDITFAKPAAETGEHQARTPPGATYQPAKPSWLGRPTTPKASQQLPQKVRQDSKSIPTQISEKLIKCPDCSKEVSFLKYCKNCGYQLHKECPHCQKVNSVTSKFCTKCGKSIKPLVEK